MSDDDAVDDANTAPPNSGPLVTDALIQKIRYVCLKQAADGQWYYRAEAGNREVVYTSEMFTRESDAKEAALREHSNDFKYVLEYAEDDVLIRETI